MSEPTTDPLDVELAVYITIPELNKVRMLDEIDNLAHALNGDAHGWERVTDE